MEPVDDRIATLAAALAAGDLSPRAGAEAMSSVRLSAALRRRSFETAAHQVRIARITDRLGAELGWTYEERRRLMIAAAMHDIGKLAVPRRVLFKPGPLSALERTIMQAHTVVGAALLLGRAGSWVALARSIALHHHERWDGKGYPRRLSRDRIPRAARIVAVADVYDALTHQRVYRPAFPEPRVVAFMRAQRGRHFDPEVIDCFLDLLPAIRRVERGLREPALDELALA